MICNLLFAAKLSTISISYIFRNDKHLTAYQNCNFLHQLGKIAFKFRNISYAAMIGHGLICFILLSMPPQICSYMLFHFSVPVLKHTQFCRKNAQLKMVDGMKGKKKHELNQHNYKYTMRTHKKIVILF